MLTKTQQKLLVLSSLGGVLEFYDFIIYALLASYIAKEFFPTGNNLTTLAATFATFSIGYLARPLGGIVFGHFGDKFGRKQTFMASILIMAISTFLIAMVPAYNVIGVAAPIILTLLRILQGLSIGGEIPGAIAYVSESIPEKKGFACGIIFCFLISGIVLGSLILAILSTFLSEADMLSWGWRIPFILGGIFGIWSYFSRKQLEESTLFTAIATKTESFPLMRVLQTKLINTLAATFIVGLGAALIVLLFLFTPAFVGTILHYTGKEYIWLRTAGIFLAAVLCIPFGLLADRFNHKKLIFILSIVSMILVYIIFKLYVENFALAWLALLLSAILVGFTWGVIPALLSELFPTAIRYSGIAVSYNLGFAIFGGLAPLVATTLIYETKLLVAPFYYIIFTALLSIIALLWVRVNWD